MTVESGARVLVAGLPLREDRDPAIPGAYYEARARDPEEVAQAIRDTGGQAHAVAMGLAADDAAAVLFATAEEALGAPVRILVHNATGWVTDPVHDFVRGSWAHHHVATPEEVAIVIAWLCSDDAWLVTGNRIVLR